MTLTVLFHFLFCYRPQRSCGQGYVFTRVCNSVHRGGSLGRETPPPGRQEEHPPPPGQAGRTSPGQGEPPWSRRHPPPGTSPPRSRHSPPPPPPGKQTPAYGQWAAGTHPTGMHSCLKKFSKNSLEFRKLCLTQCGTWSGTNCVLRLECKSHENVASVSHRLQCIWAALMINLKSNRDFRCSIFCRFYGNLIYFAYEQYVEQ